MPQDAFTLRYLCEELDALFAGGKINRIVQPNVNATVFTVYTFSGVKRLILDVNPSCPRIGIAETEPFATSATYNFCMLLRKHLLSATIEKISLVGFDRIVRIDLAPSTEFFDAAKKSLYVELMGRYSNVILTENGKVLGGNRGINFLDNNVRPLITGMEYRLPPVGDKAPPDDISLKERFVSGENLAENICAFIQGIAPSTAKEIERGYFDKCDRFDTQSFLAYLNDYIRNSQKNPCVFYENGTAVDVCVYPYKTLKNSYKTFDSLYTAEDAFFSEKESRKRFKDLYDKLLSVANTGIKKCKKRLFAVLSRIAEAENAEENRIKGELILANIYRLKGGEENVVFTNYYDGTETEIKLDARLSPSANAESYYKKYNKQKRALASLIPQKEAAEQDVLYLESVTCEIALCETFSDLKAVEDELYLSGIIKKPNLKNGKKAEEILKPKTYAKNGWTIKVGRNNAENDKITFSAKPTDIWLHAKDYHSAHVIIETGGKKPPDSVITAAAEICAYYSKGRDGGKTEVVYCEKKYVKKPKKSALGFCTYTDYKSVTVTPAVHAEMLKER